MAEEEAEWMKDVVAPPKDTRVKTEVLSS